MQLLKTLWRLLVGIKDALVLLLLLLFFGGIWALLSEPSSPKGPSSGAALRLKLAGTLVEQASPRNPLILISGASVVQETEVGPIVQALDLAAKDKAISMAVLDLDGFMGGGFANLQTLGEALDRFRESGKTIEAFSTYYNDDAYYLATRANQINLAPLGAVVINGFGGNSLYFKKLIDKLDINVEVFRVGTYKSFVEPFTRSESSPEARMAQQTLVDDLWDVYVSDVEAQRPQLALQPMLNNWADTVRETNTDQARLAKNKGLVDQVISRQQFVSALNKKVGKGQKGWRSDDYNFVDAADYAEAKAPVKRTGAGVAVVYLTGSIVDGTGIPGEAGGATVSQLIAKALDDSSVKALVVRIDSPGGSVMASEQIRQALLQAREKNIPVVASFGPVAASGGYWVATAADKIYAKPATLTGSIGVFGIIPTFERSLASIGVTTDGVSTTPFSGQPDITGGLNPETRILIQSGVEDTYRQFLEHVAKARNLPVAEVEALAEGRVWSGKRALEHKLIDEFGGLDDAINAAGQLAKLGDKPRVIEVKEDFPFFWQMAQQLVFAKSATETAPQTDGLSLAVQASRARAMSEAQEAMQMVNGAAIQARCLPCIGYSPVRNWPTNNQILPNLVVRMLR